MKKVIFTTSLAALAMAFQASAADLVEKLSDEASCEKAAQLVTLGMTSNSDTTTVTATLETALKAKSSCACEIVQEVIEATGADAKDKAALISAIVETAIKALPESTAAITECAVAAAPAHAATIEKVLNKVFADADQEFLGESSAKQVVEEEEAHSKQDSSKQWTDGDDDGELDPEGVYPAYALPAPVYLIAPSGGVVPPGELVEGVSPSNFKHHDD